MGCQSQFLQVAWFLCATFLPRFSRFCERPGRPKEAHRHADLKDAGGSWPDVWPSYVEYRAKCDEERLEAEAEKKAEQTEAAKRFP